MKYSKKLLQDMWMKMNQGRAFEESVQARCILYHFFRHNNLSILLILMIIYSQNYFSFHQLMPLYFLLHYFSFLNYYFLHCYLLNNYILNYPHFHAILKIQTIIFSH